MEPVLKTGDAAMHRGFESHPLRHDEMSLPEKHIQKQAEPPDSEALPVLMSNDILPG